MMNGSEDERGWREPARIDVVIVNWNTGPLLRHCIAALDRSSIARQLAIVVIDNASTDGSAAGLTAVGLRPDVVCNRENRGFAAACNQGVARGDAPFVLLLNPDVRVEPETLARALAYIDDPARASIGVLGVQLLDAQGRVQRCCAREPGPVRMILQAVFLDRICPALVRPHFLTDWDHGDTRTVDQVIGAFLLIRRSLLARLGGLDERYFLYYEDVDLCAAARSAGYQVVHFAGARAQHLGGGSTDAVKDHRLLHHAVSRVRYMAKYHGRLASAVLAGVILLVELPIRCLHAMLTRSPHESWLVLRAAALFLRGRPGRDRP